MDDETCVALDYGRLRDAFERGALAGEALAELLCDGRAANYRATTAGEVELVEVDQGKLTCLFDILNAGTVGVYGRSAPRTGE
jgi:hypothetical protein